MSTITPELLEHNAILRARFFEVREIPQEYRISQFERLHGFIYCIENKTNGKKYIGCCYSLYTDVKNPDYYSSLRKRANDYIYEYNRAMRTMPSVIPTLRSIVQAMVQEGIENFVMYPIAETTSTTHKLAENFFIEKFDTINSGYNRMSSGINLNGKRGRIQSEREKLAKSDPILAVHLNNRQLVYADSMKLFGDFLGTSKDMIKNNARSGRSYKGWFIFYIDQDKRKDILTMVMEDRLTAPGDKCNRNHSEKSKAHYLDLYKVVSNYISHETGGMFEGFERLPDIVYAQDVDLRAQIN